MPKDAMSSFDVLATVRELSAEIVGARIDKAFQPTREEVLLRVRVSADQAGEDASKRELVISPGRYVFASRIPRVNPTSPSQFAMMLRKNIGNGRILDVRQHGFDRVIEIDIGKKDGMHTLIVELFHDGNIVLTQHGKIVACLFHQSWATRQVRPGAEFVYAPSSPNILEFEEADFERAMRESDADIVRTLAVGIGVGGQWAEEIALAAGVPKNKPVSEVTAEDMSALWVTLRAYLDRLRSGELESVVVLDEKGEREDVSPVPRAANAGKVVESYPSFQHALDRYYSPDVAEAPREDPRVTKVREVKDRFGRQVAQMEGALKKFAKEEEAARAKGELVYAHFDIITRTLDTLRAAAREKGWLEVAERIREASRAKSPDVAHIENVNAAEGTLALVLADIDGKPGRVTLDVRKSVQDNANVYYERAKKMRDKQAGALKALDDVRARLLDAEKEGAKVLAKLERDAQKAPPTKRLWFESFRWFVSSDGGLVLGGRDAGTNERVVKKHLDATDRYVHANVAGAPSVVVKTGGAEPSERTLEEACQFAVLMSKAWTAGYGASDAYWVMPAQVSKTPQAGEYLGRGAFIVRGKRTSVTCDVLAAVGEIEYEGQRKVMGGPVSAVKAHAKRFVVLAPGQTSKNVIANRLAELFHVPVEEIQTVLPPGDVSVVESRGLEL